MNFWYGVIRDKFGKVRSKRTSTQNATTQDDFLVLMKFNPDAGEVVVELDCGNHMDSGQFVSYVDMMYQNASDIKVIFTELENLVGR